MIGTFTKSIDSNIIEAISKTGLDFIILDQEHGISNKYDLHNHVRAIVNSSVRAIVRVEKLCPYRISTALDSGASGVQIPNISNKEQAESAVKNAKFFPLGERGVCRFVKAAGFGSMSSEKYFIDENKKLVILQVEGAEGLKNIDSILKVEGFDILFIGPYDLSQSLGVPGQVNHPKVLDAIKYILNQSKLSGKVLGSFCDTYENLRMLKNLGFEYLAFGVDMNMIQSSYDNLINNYNEK